MITRKELINNYIKFFEDKGHKEIPNCSLIPLNDPTVLFTTAGMHPLVPFLLGQPHPLGKRLVNVQRCIRTTDIDEVGDKIHHTFFEMLGNWSLGDYWKDEALKLSFKLATAEYGLSLERIGITVFGGDQRFPEIPKDEEASMIWERLGITKSRIVYLKGGVIESKENWWGPAGKTGPCGPCTELFYWAPNDIPVPESFDTKDERWVELWNDVLMQYNKDEHGKYIKASQQNIDNGRGLERILAALNNFDDNYLTEVWRPLITILEEKSGKKYDDYQREMRIIADHIKATVFILADGVIPSNTEQGYILRRLIRRAIVNLRKLELEENSLLLIAESVFGIYDDYDDIQKNKRRILDEIKKEEEKFANTLEKGLKEFEKMSKDKIISGKEAFLLFQSYGFPLEMTEELSKEKGITVDVESFNEEQKKHQELSRTAAQGKFSSGLADDSEATTALHTATHLLNEALRQVLKDPNIKQKGSNITPERLRFDFNFDRKLTPEEKKAVEDYVNEKIKQALPVERGETSLKDALASGAQAEFGAKYPDQVSVYTIKDDSEKKGWMSKEICIGPHVKNTSELRTFKIKKEESSAAGVRRIKAVLE